MPIELPRIKRTEYPQEMHISHEEEKPASITAGTRWNKENKSLYYLDDKAYNLNHRNTISYRYERDNVPVGYNYKRQPKIQEEPIR